MRKQPHQSDVIDYIYHNLIYLHKPSLHPQCLPHLPCYIIIDVIRCPSSPLHSPVGFHNTTRTGDTHTPPPLDIAIHRWCSPNSHFFEKPSASCFNARSLHHRFSHPISVLSSGLTVIKAAHIIDVVATGHVCQSITKKLRRIIDMQHTWRNGHHLHHYHSPAVACHCIWYRCRRFDKLDSYFPQFNCW